ncbi:MAG: glycoside hydrolase family 99-like domain-containing protein, partial [Candidatus Caldarchaeum sp.]
LRESEQERERLTQQLAEQEQLTKQLMEKEQQIGILQARLSDIQARITALLNSKSWRLTAPLRWVYALSKRLFGIFRKDDLHLVRHCRLFDAQWYLQHNPDVTQAGIDPAWHYLHQGWREGRDPSPDFSTRWYLDTYKDVAKMGMNPLVHYLRYGRKEKRLPKPPETASEAKLEDRSSLMMRAWRIMRWIFLNPHRVPSLSRRAWDILQQEGIQGLRQAFPRFVRRVQYEDTVSNLKQHIAPADDRYYEAYISQLAIAQNKRGDEYVDYDESVDLSKKNLPAKLIAFYLPQFHPVPENDQWWGKGFTEWTNVSKAAPQFVGHYQPHLPGELGFYDLRVPEVQRRQVELAKKYGIYGFCFYYYWFDGKKLLERPLKQFVSDPQIDLPFCLCWANENWTRRWDGLDQEILIAQNHSLEGDTRFIEDILPYLQHPRYIRIQGRPILLVYRAHHLSDPKAVTQRWREFCKNKGVGDPYLIAVQSFGFFDDPQTLGFDAAVEFPPHLPLNSADIPAITEIQLLNPNFEGRIYNYGDVVRYMLQKPKPQYRLFRTVMPGWDNTPRRLNTPTIFVNNTPELYKNWLSSVLNEAVNCHLTEERIVFINAWNEWAEGNHLEPDRKLGYAYLHATAEALLSLESPRSKHPRGKGWRLLFVSHDAHRAGAQLVLLELIRWLKQHTTLTMGLVCLKGGPLVETFQKLLPTWVLPPNCSEKEALAKILELMEGPPDLIYGNTVAAGRIYPLLARLSRPIITHVHELDTSIRYYAKDVIKDTLYYTNAYITVSQAVKQYFLQKHGIPEKNCFVAHAFTKPAGLPIPDNEEKMRLRKQLGLYQDHFLVMGCGRGMPFRKGADLLIQVARDLKAKGITKVHFYWVGEFDENFADPELGRWSDHIRKAFAEGLDAYVTFLGFKDNPRQYLRAGDLFLLTSREDPFPLVMLEAAECGLPILCFNDSGGAPEFVQNDVGYVVPFGDTAAMADQIIKLMKDDALRISLGIRAHQRAGEFTPDRICPKILSVARKVAGKPPKITIIVPNYNHASYLPQRLESIFHQTFQDFEVILMDDASTDNSVEILKQWGNHPDVRLIVNEQNSGSPCKQWVKALNMAEGELIWIAESDDLCEPTFLESLLPAFDDPEVKLAYSASRIINEKGEVQGDYTQTDYLRSLSPTKWQQSYCVPAEQEINEGLGIKNTVLNISAALFRRFAWDEQFLKTLAKMRVGGDWFLILNAIKGGKIYYEAQLLNYHRRHSQSIIGKVLSSRDEQYLREFFTDYSINLQYVIENFALSENFFYRLNEYIKELWSILGQGRSPKDLEKYFP